MSMTKKEKLLLAKKEKKVKLQKATECYKEGIEKYHKAKTRDEYEDAAESYTVAISLRPANPKYYFARANCFRAMGEYQRGFFDYSAAIQLDNECATYYGNRGICLRKLGQTDEAVQDYTTALKLDPSNGNNYFNRALVYYETGQMEEAISDYTQATNDVKYAFKAFYNRGNCYRKMGMLIESVKDLKAAVEKEPTNSSGHNNLGLSYFEMKSFDEAAECFTNAIKLEKTNASYHNNRGLCFYHMGGAQLPKSLQDFETAIEYDPEEPNYYFNRGNARLGLGLLLASRRQAEVARGRREAAGKASGAKLPLKKPQEGEPDADDEALAHLRCDDETVSKLQRESLGDLTLAVELAPTSAKYTHSIGLAHQQMEHTELALAFFERALSLDAKHMPSRYHAGLMMHKLGDHDGAVDAFSEVLGYVQNDPLVFESRGLVLQTMGDHQNAVEDFTAALKLTGEGSGGEDHYYRGESLLALGRYSLALADMNIALELGWVDAAVFHARAMTKQVMGEEDIAIDDFTAALEQEPDNVKFLYDRGQCYRSIGLADKAEEDLTKALEETPGELRLLYGAALAAYEQGKDRVTIVHMTQALSVWDEGTSSGLAHGVLCDIHYHLGLAHANVGYYGNAIEWFTRAISDPKIDVEVKVNIIHERAKAHQMERMFTEAIDDFTAVIKYNPRNAHAHFRRGFAWKSMGQFEKAADDLETAKILDPSNPHLVVNYSQIHDTECVILCSAGEEKAYK